MTFRNFGLILAGAIGSASLAHAAPLLGVNMSGLEQGSGTVAYTNYAVPTPPFTGDMPGPVQVMRVPFLMSRVYQGSPAMLNAAYVGYLQAIGKWCLANGIVPIFDDHEYGSTGVAGAASTDITTTAGTLDLDLEWAGLVGSLPTGSAIDLMNEPTSQANSGLVTAYNATIAAVRAKGFTGTIFVEPNGYARAAQVTGTWTDLNGIVDPLKNTDLEVHWYLDPSDNGAGGDPTSATAAATVMQGIVAYQQSGKSPFAKVLLGETGAAQSGNVVDAAQTAALKNELAVIAANPSVFYGVTMWAAGPWWPASYAMDLNMATNAAYLLAEQVFTPLTVYLSEDAYQGDAAASVSVDGTQAWSGTVTATRLGAPQAVTIPGTFKSGTHTIAVTFSNDAYGGSVTTDRNLYVNAAAWNGTLATGDCYAALYSNGTFNCHLVVP